MKLPILAAAAAATALFSACSSGGVATPAAPAVSLPSRDLVLDGLAIHVFPAAGVNVQGDPESGTPRSAFAAMQSTSQNLTWHGGAVQPVPRIYITFWGRSWTTADGEYKALTGFFNAMGSRRWINIDTQHFGSNGPITNPAAQLTATWIDASAAPPSPAPADVAAEAQKSSLHFRYSGANANFIIAIEKGHDPHGFGTYWCGWHSYRNEPQGFVAFTALPYQSDAGARCGAGSVNKPGTYDGVSIVAGHEEAETQTDPHPGTGWIDANRLEIGDKCAWMNLADNPNAGGFPTQPLWDNHAGKCAQSGP